MLKPHMLVDGYKTGHIFQYPEGTEFVYSNFTPRSSKLAKMPKTFDNKVVFFGLQGLLIEFLMHGWDDGFFKRPKHQVVAEYKRRMDNYLGPDAVPVDHIADLHDLGYLPLLIKALPEGSRVNIKVPVLTMVNTDHRFFWLTNYVETFLSAELWKPITTATTAYEFRRVLDQYVEATGSSKEFADWQLHDFSFRGMSGWHDAASSGAAHLIAAGYGTDTLPAIDYLEDYYLADSDKELVGGSVPATEHSVMCMGGKEDEIETFRRLIQDVYPSGVVSIVSDTWDFWQVITGHASTLKDVILNRTPNALGLAKVVFRPDSGDPADILCGTANVISLDEARSLEEAKSDAEDMLAESAGEATDHGEMGPMDISGFFSYKGVIYKAEIEIEWNRYDKQYYYMDGHKLTKFEPATLTPEEKGAVQCLWEIFGGDITDKGYKTLNQRVGLIYGDSITLAVEEDILKRLMAKGFSAGNVVFGIGSFTYQYVTRDTHGNAVKATWGRVKGEMRELEKDPKTGDGLKKSAKGLLRVTKDDEGNFILHDQQVEGNTLPDEMQTVFYNGKVYNYQTTSDIRKLVKSN